MAREFRPTASLPHQLSLVRAPINRALTSETIRSLLFLQASQLPAPSPHCLPRSQIGRTPARKARKFHSVNLRRRFLCLLCGRANICPLCLLRPFQLLLLPTPEHPRLFASTRLLNYKNV